MHHLLLTAWITLLCTPLAGAVVISDLSERISAAKQEVVRGLDEIQWMLGERRLASLDVLYPPMGDPGSHALALPERSGLLLIDPLDLNSVLLDVPVTAWFASYVRNAVLGDILTEYNNSDGSLTRRFGPGDPLTIEQLAKAVVMAAGVDVELCIDGDEPANRTASDWSAPFIACLESMQSPLFEDGNIVVTDPATRGQTAVTVLHLFGRELEKFSGEIFRDVDLFTPFSRAIETAAIDGLLTGYRDASGNQTGVYGSEDPISRAEMAKVAITAIDLYR